MTRRIWLVRHGNTFAAGEPARRIGNRTDLPLTAEGRAQGEWLRAAFARQDIVFDAAYAGPLQRARQTAAIVLDGSGLAAATLPILDEIDHGPDEGEEEAAVRARIGSAALSLWDKEARPPEGWIVDAEARLAGWYEFLAAQARLPEGDTLCVSSNGALRFALMALSRAGEIEQPASLAMRTGAFGRIDLSNQRFTLQAWDVRPD